MKSNDTKQVVILINSLEAGGAERVVSNLLNLWVEKYDCYLILIHNYKFYKIDNRIKIISLNEPKELSGFVKFARLPILAYKLSQIIKEYKFDKVISFLTRANYINVLSNIYVKHQVIISERSTPSLQYQNGINGKINKFLIKMLYPKAALCLSNSHGNMLDLKNNFNVSKLTYIHNPFNLATIEDMSKEEIKIKKKRFTFVTVGRLNHGKNHKLILDAIKDIDADLWIIGDGKLKGELEKQIQELQLESKVMLLGKKENPFAYLAKADCFVFASNYEGFPNVLVEALACGLSIISTDFQSGSREILAPNSNINFQLKDDMELAEYGILTPIKNIEKIKEAINLIINDEKLRKNYQDKAKQRASDFRIEEIIKRYEEVYFDISNCGKKNSLNRRIVICLNTSWNIYNFRMNLARALKHNDYEVVLVAPYDKYSDILSQEFEYHHVYMNNKGTNPKEDIKTVIDFYRLYKTIKPDIVLNYTIKPNIHGNIACGLLGIKTINNISGLGTVFIKESFVTKVVKRLYRYSLSKSSKVFFQNSDDMDFFVKSQLVDFCKCDLLPGSGIDTNQFVPVEYKNEDDTFRFLLIARMLWDKGIGEYVEAVKILKSKYLNVEFQLLGSLDAINNTAISKRQVDEWIDEGFINYLGVTDDVKEFIKKVDCVVLPSYREGTPRTLLESASMAKPIVTTNTVGCKEVVDDNINGYLCEVKNGIDLAKKMEMMLNLSEAERKSMGEAGRKKMINEFNEKIVIDKYLEAMTYTFQHLSHF